MTLHNGRIRQTTALLTAEEERQLAQEIEAGADASTRVERGDSLPGDLDLVTAGKAARARFIEANMRLVLSIASKAGAPAHGDLQRLHFVSATSISCALAAGELYGGLGGNAIDRTISTAVAVDEGECRCRGRPTASPARDPARKRW